MGFQKRVGTIGILLSSISAMVGSGWLFSSLYAAQMAGPAAIISWLLAGIFVMIIALTFAEVGSLFPIAGGIANYSFFTHGKFVGFLMGWVSWLSFVMLAPVEVQAALQYATNFFPWLTDHHHLTLYGYIAATVVMFMMVVINLVGMGITAKANNIFSIWKLIIPGIAVLTYLMYSPSLHNLGLESFSKFAPHGLHGIVQALAVAGVVFSFNGFQVAILLASETKNPQKSIPRALIGSILIGIVIYGMLQFSFILAIPSNIVAQGWSHLAFPGDAGPLAGLAAVLGASAIASLLYIDAVIAPTGAGLVYVTSTSRILYGLARNGYLPQSVAGLNKSGIPVKAIWINFIVGMFAFLPFPGWQSMVAFLSSIMVATYAIVPICLVSLRNQHPELKRPFHLPFGKFISFLALYLCNIMLFWTGFDVLYKLFLCMIAGMIAYSVTFMKKHKRKFLGEELKKVLWIIWYFGGISIISLFGSFGGGLNLYRYHLEYILVAAFSFVILKMSNSSALPSKESHANILSIVEPNHMSQS